MTDLADLWRRYLERQALSGEEQAALQAALQVDQAFASECRQDLRQHGAMLGLMAPARLDLVADISQQLDRPRSSHRPRSRPRRPRGPGSWLPLLLGLAVAGGLWWSASRATDHDQPVPTVPSAGFEQVPPFEPIRIAFGATAAEAAAGWVGVADLSYTATTGMGWTTDHPRRYRDRRGDGHRYVVFAGGSWFQDQWEIAVPAGTYLVKLTCGDKKAEQGPHLVEVEGAPLFRGERTEANQFLTRSITVAVTDGRLTVTVGGTTPLRDDQDPEVEIHLTDTGLVTLEIESAPAP